MSETKQALGQLLVKGHLYRDCSTAKDSKILIATGENDTADEDVYDSAAFLIEDGADINAKRTVTSDTVFFSSTEVLLDNQAGPSIFKNRSLLHNTTAVVPFYIGGIDGG